jgi:hypothetical protein
MLLPGLSHLKKSAPFPTTSKDYYAHSTIKKLNICSGALCFKHHLGVFRTGNPKV